MGLGNRGTAHKTLNSSVIKARHPRRRLAYFYLFPFPSFPLAIPKQVSKANLNLPRKHRFFLPRLEHDNKDLEPTRPQRPSL